MEEVLFHVKVTVSLNGRNLVSCIPNIATSITAKKMLKISLRLQLTKGSNTSFQLKLLVLPTLDEKEKI